MKKYIILCGLLLMISISIMQAQNKIYSAKKIAGAPQDIILKTAKAMPNGFVSPKRISASQYSTTVFTFSDITIFSYFDNTEVNVTYQDGTSIGSAVIKADTLFSFSPGQGIYNISGNKPYSILIGDAITNYVNGYFALDQSGRGKSTKLNTWMMSGNDYDPHFIIFAYEDGTEYTIKELSTGAFVYAGTLNNGKYLDFPNVYSIQEKALQVVSNKPVSVLSYTDQDYYVPSANGTFAGTLFYGFSGNAGGWENSITISSYSNNNQVLVTDLDTQDTLGLFTLGQWQVRTIPIYQDTFWKIQSTGTVTAANIPYAGYPGSYYYMARTADSTGLNFGTSFIVPTNESQISIFSYDDNNRVSITYLGDTTYPYISSTEIADTLLQKGEGYIFDTPYGNNVYHVSAQKNVSVVQSSGGYGADFMPLGYVFDLPDIALTNNDIQFDPASNSYATGDQIDINISVSNYGTANSSNILVEAFDGDPDAGYAPVIGKIYIPNINAGSKSTVTFKYVIPKDAKYHYIYVKVDPIDLIAESNESNNKAYRALIPNSDLLPPLAITITAPGALARDSISGTLTPNPFTVTANIFNTGNVSATNVHAVLSLFNGLTLISGPADTVMGDILASGTKQIVWKISANQDSSSLNFYSLSVGGDNAATKYIYRAVNVPDVTAPGKPVNLIASALTENNAVMLKWDQNIEADLGGYNIYYGTDSTNYNGTGADEGDSPIAVSQLKEYTITGLTPKVKYWFAIRAIDFSGNMSEYSDNNSATPLVTGILKTTLGIPKDYALSQNFPNPFNPTTLIRFDMPKAGFVRIELYNTIGQKVASLLSAEKPAGRYEISLDASRLSSGTYFYRMDAGGNVLIKKMLLMK